MSKPESKTNNAVYPDGGVRPIDLPKAYDNLRAEYDKLEKINKQQSKFIIDKDAKIKSLESAYVNLNNRYKTALDFIKNAKEAFKLQLKELDK